MVCLETSFLIDIIRGKEDVRARLDEIERDNSLVTIATPSIIELIKGTIIGDVRENEREEIEDLISSFMILGLDKKSAIKAGEVEGDLLNTGQKIDLEDIMIAAITITNNEKLITKNEKHFSRIKELEFEIY